MRAVASWRAADPPPAARTAGLVFCLALVLGLQGRVEEDELRTFGALANVFGRNFYDHTMVIWTHGDLIANEGGLPNYLAGCGPAIGAFLGEVKGHVVVNNQVRSAITCGRRLRYRPAVSGGWRLQ